MNKLLLVMLFLIPFTSAVSFGYDNPTLPRIVNQQSSITQVTGDTISNSTQCSGTDKIYNVTILNGKLTVLCGTDQGGAGSGDNSSWNESYANTLYAEKRFGYNETSIILNGYTSQFNATYNVSYHNLLVYGYNQTSALLDGYVNQFNSTQNITYQNWNVSYANTLYCGIQFGYNETAVILDGYANQFNTTTNTTYNTYAYNQSDGSYNITYQNWNKTYADTLYALIGSGDNSSWNQSHANTLYASIIWNYNQSLALYNQFNSQWNSTYNVTYNTWAYNQSEYYKTNTSLVLKNSTNSIQVANISCSQIIGGTDSNFCSDADSGGSPSPDTVISKFQNITNIPTCTSTQVLTNRTGGGLQCVESSGTSYIPPVTISFGGFVTLTNVGANYDTTDASRGLGMSYVNMSGVTAINCTISYNKIGAGIQNFTLYNVNDAVNILGTADAGGTGAKLVNLRNSTLASMTNYKLLRWRALSSTTTDDPTWHGATCIFER